MQERSINDGGLTLPLSYNIIIFTLIYYTFTAAIPAVIIVVGCSYCNKGDAAAVLVLELRPHQVTRRPRNLFGIRQLFFLLPVATAGGHAQA
jgi:hypothetical protein